MKIKKWRPISKGMELLRRRCLRFRRFGRIMKERSEVVTTALELSMWVPLEHLFEVPAISLLPLRVQGWAIVSRTMFRETWGLLELSILVWLVSSPQD